MHTFAKLTSLFFLVSCGGNAFEGTSLVFNDASTVTDAYQEPTEVDAASLPPEAGADMLGKGEASVTVEASTDAGVLLDALTDAGAPEATLDAARGDSAEGGEPMCSEGEVWPAYSTTCDMWGQTHGWSLQGCCLSDRTCGTVRDLPTRGCYR